MKELTAVSALFIEFIKNAPIIGRLILDGLWAASSLIPFICVMNGAVLVVGIIAAVIRKGTGKKFRWLPECSFRHSFAAFLVLLLLVSPSLAFRSACRDVSKKQAAMKERIRKEGMNVTCTESKFEGDSLAETYTLTNLKKGKRYRVTSSARIEMSYGKKGFLPDDMFTAKKTSAEVEGTGKPVTLRLSYDIPQSKRDAGATYSRLETVTTSDAGIERTLTKTRSGLFTIEEIS